MTETFTTVTVLGAGAMGRGIAQVAAQAGLTTRLFDPQGTALESARETIERRLAKGVELGKLEPAASRQASSLLTVGSDLGQAVTGADLVIEAVPESFALKAEIFARVAASAADATLFATNTSALSVTELGSASGRPDRFAGMHFFNPVHLMPLVELVRGRDTSPSTLAALAAVAGRMGKEVVTVADSPGFVTTRVNALIGNEAFRMLEDGTASAREIDRALKLGLRHPMGPFEMIDFVGLDVRLSILEHLHATLGEAYRPSPLLVRLVAEGRLGRKSGRGVYRYDDSGKRRD